MIRGSIAFFLLTTFSLSTLAATKDTIVLVPAPDKSIGGLEVSNQGQSVRLTNSGEYTSVSSKAAPTDVAVMSEEVIDQKFGRVLAGQPRQPRVFTLFFGVGESRIPPDEQAGLTEIIQAATARQHVEVTVEGFTDRQGDAEKNLALSRERAEYVKATLVAQGISPDAFTLTFHGENELVVDTEDNVAEARNRRVDITLR